MAKCFEDAFTIDSDLAVNVTQNVAHYQFKFVTSNSLGEVAFT